MILTILLLGLLLRLIGLNQSYWLDESIGVLEVKQKTITELLTQFLKVDNHPPLYYVILDVWTQIFGYSEVPVRMLTVILGVAAIYLVYKIVQRLTSNIAISSLAAFFLATSQFHVYYSQEARMYSMAAFFASLAIYLLLVLQEKKHEYSTKTWSLFSLCLIGLAFTDYMPILLWGTFVIFALINRKSRKWWLYFITSHLPLIILGVLWLPTFITQTQGGRWLLKTLPQWKSVAGGASFKQAILVWMKFVGGRISLINKYLYYSFVLLASLPVLIGLLKALKDYKKYLLIWLWLLFPLISGFVMSFSFPAFNYFRYTYIIPAFYILLAAGLWSIKNRLLRNSLIVSLCCIHAISLSIYYFDVRQQREQWREAVVFIEERLDESSIVLFEYPEPFTPYRWYSTKLQGFGATDSISTNSPQTHNRTQELIKDKQTVYYFEYLADLTDPERVVLDTIRDNGFVLKEENASFEGIGKISIWQKI